MLFFVINSSKVHNPLCFFPQFTGRSADKIQDICLVPETLQFFHEQRQFLNLSELTAKTGLAFQNGFRNSHALTNSLWFRDLSAFGRGCILGLIEIEIAIPVFADAFTAQAPGAE